MDDDQVRQLPPTPLVRPARATRTERRQQRRATARLASQRRRARREQVAAQRRDDDEEPTGSYLPRAGAPGPRQLRAWRPLRVATHQDTTATAAAIYPFVAEEGLTGRGVFVGQDLFSRSSFVFDPWELYAAGQITAPNLVLAGTVGVGKSALAKALVCRSIPFGRKVTVAADPKGEWTAVARQVGGVAIVLGHGLATRLNPLDAGNRPARIDPQLWQVQVAARRRDLVGALAATVLGRELSPVEHTAVDLALASATGAATVPILPAVVDRLLEPDPGHDDRLADDGRLVAHALRRMVAGDLSGLFDGPSTVAFDATAPIVSIDLSRVAQSDALLSVLMTCASAWMEAALADPDAGQRWVVYDEGWRLIADPALLRRMDSQWRLSRSLGIANLLVVHKLNDLDTAGDAGSAARAVASSLLALAEVRIAYRQEADQVASTGRALGLTEAEMGLLPGLGLGQGLWRIRDHAWVIQHQLVPAEARLFDTTAKMTNESHGFRASRSEVSGT